MAIVRPESYSDRVIDLFIHGEKEYSSFMGIPAIDELWQIRRGENTYITGYPTSGKSVILRNGRRHLTQTYGYKHLVFGPEEGNVERQILKIALNQLGINISKYGKLPNMERIASDLVPELRKMQNHYLFLDYPEGLPKYSKIKEEILLAHKHWPYDSLTIDPFSYIKLESSPKTEAIEETLGDLNLINKALNFHMFIVAHPRKPTPNSDGSLNPPDPYQFAHSAEWFNKADNIVILHREGELTRFIKCKTKDTGAMGELYLRFNIKTGEYQEAVPPNF